MGDQPSVDKQLKAVMEFYIRSFFDVKKEKYLEHARKMNVFGLDPDIVEKQALDYLEIKIEEATEKFHSIAFIVLQGVVTLEEEKLRKFELLFIDLLDRTLLKDMDAPVTPLARMIEENSN